MVYKDVAPASCSLSSAHTIVPIINPFKCKSLAGGAALLLPPHYTCGGCSCNVCRVSYMGDNVLVLRSRDASHRRPQRWAQSRVCVCVCVLSEPSRTQPTARHVIYAQPFSVIYFWFDYISLHSAASVFSTYSVTTPRWWMMASSPVSRYTVENTLIIWWHDNIAMVRRLVARLRVSS